ncbi:MAG: SNF2 helicase associated domain-containing protein, partial [Deltaproteobacteria bacterium]|nr:SNF2 helicase associated domain-containing protein [Deltaproteobacteria bacterium]
MSQTHSNPIEESSGLQFKYQLGFDARRNALLIRILDGEKSVTRFEKYGIHVLSLQDRYHSSSKLDPVHRHFVQHLLRFGKVDSWENIYVVPRAHAGYFLQRLSRFKNVASFIPSKPLAFSKQILVPQFQFKGKNFSQFELEVSLRDKEEGKKVSFEDLQVFSGSRTWILIKGVFFAVEDIDIEHLLESMNSKGFINLEGEAAAQFVEKDLEGLLERKLLQLPKSILLPSVERHLPKAQYEFSEEDSEEALTLKLHFLYGEHSLPPFEHEKNSLASVEKDKKVYLVCRRIGFEKDILERLQDQGFSRVGIDLFQNVGERALDFVSEKLPSFQNDSEVLGLSQLRRYRIDAYLGIDQLKVKKETRGMNWLGFDLKYQVGSWEVSFDFVRESLKAGKRYLRIPGGGVARIVEEDIRRLEETFEELGGRWNDQGLLEVQSFHAPYLDEMLQIDWKEESEFEKGIKSLRKLTEISETPLPENLKAVLRPYQHHGYSWMNFLHEHQFHGILADDMGLGKTLQALTFLKNLKDQKGSRPNLVLAPTSVVFNWAAEAEKFTPDLKVVQLSGIERKGMYDQIEGADLVLTSYAIFRRDAEILSKRDWRVVILDEAQYIKNFRSKTASLVKELKAEQRMALTGTPLENRLSELWSIIDFLIPNFLGNYSLFQRRYQKPI